MDQEELDILQAVKELDEFDEYCKANPIKAVPPSTFRINMMGASDNVALRFLFSTGLDHMVDKFMELIISGGSLEEILASDSAFASMMEKMGFDSSKIFKGEVSKTLIASIDKVIDSNSYKRTKTKLLKVIKIYQGMKRGAKTIKDPELRAKYEEAARSVMQIIRFVGKIYKNRRLVNERVQKGISVIFNESYDDSICILESFDTDKFTQDIKHDDNGDIVKFFLNGKELGHARTATYKKKDDFVHDVEVVENMRGKGYGTKIMKWMMKEYPIKWLNVAKDNEVAINLYKKLGFKRTQNVRMDDGSIMDQMELKKDS